MVIENELTAQIDIVGVIECPWCGEEAVMSEGSIGSLDLGRFEPGLVLDLRECACRNCGATFPAPIG